MMAKKRRVFHGDTYPSFEGKEEGNTRRMRRPMTLIAVLAAFSLLAAACGDDGPEAEGTVNLAFEEFLDTEVANALADTVLTDLGYTVEWTSLDIGLIYQSIVDEDLDVYVGGWLPTGQADYWNVHGQDLERLGPLHNEALLGACVPQTETDVNSWQDLQDPAVAERFDNVIVGHFAGSATMLRTDDAILNYGLDFDLLESSVAAMMAEVTPKLDAGEPVAWVCWYPMWWWARWDIKFLEDPLGAYPEADGAYNIVRQGFKDEPGKEAAYCYFNNVRLSADEQSELMRQVGEEGRDSAEVLREWVDANQDRVEEWTAGC